MSFSIRTALLVTAMVATLLGALVSKSPLFLEVVSTLIYLGIALTLPFAIWDPQPSRRAFWTGFFVLGLANVLLSHQLGGFQHASTQLASLMVPQPPNVNSANAGTLTAQSITIYSPVYGSPVAYPFNQGAPSSSPYAIWGNNGGAYYEQFNATRSALLVMFSLVIGAVGGWLTMLVWRNKPANETKQQSPA